jgi:hypothetical protein
VKAKPKLPARSEDLEARREIDLLRFAVGRRGYQRLGQEIDKLMEEAIKKAFTATREDHPAVQMMMFLLGRVMPDIKESVFGGQATSGNSFHINIIGIDRGTTEAREAATRQIESRKLQIEAREVEFEPSEEAGRDQGGG